MPKGNKYDPVRSEGMGRLSTAMSQDDSKKWMQVDGQDALNVSSLASSTRRTSNQDPSNNNSIVSTTHRDPEPAMDPTKDKDLQ